MAKEKRWIHESRTDGLKLSVLCIEPDNVKEAKGIVQLVHGMNEYKGVTFRSWSFWL